MQYQAIRAALGYRKSTPTNILLAEAKLPLIRERAKLLGNRYVLKTLSNDNNPMYKHIIYHASDPNKNKRLLRECITSMSALTDSVTIHESLLYNYNFNTGLTSIPVDFEFGSRLRTDKNPNQTLNSYLIKHPGIAIYTDCRKY